MKCVLVTCNDFFVQRTRTPLAPDDLLLRDALQARGVQVDSLMPLWPLARSPLEGNVKFGWNLYVQASRTDDQSVAKGAKS